MIDSHPEDVEELLDRFRRWLEAVQAEAESIGASGPGYESGTHAGAEGPRPEFGLVNLAEEFTALRHELKLQTKSGRGLIDQAESMVDALRQAIEQFRSVEPKELQAAWAAGRPVAEALGDLDEALHRGRREIERISRYIVEDAVRALTEILNQRYRRQWWYRRWLTRDYHRQVMDAVAEAGRVRRELFDALLEGLGLIHTRLARVMAAERIERIPTEGNPVDPERMIVLEVTDDPDRPPGTVTRELRSGYTWKGRLLRYAEVQAASALSGSNLASAVNGPATGEDAAAGLGLDDDLYGEETAGEGDAGAHAHADIDTDGENSEGFDLNIRTDDPGSR